MREYERFVGSELSNTGYNEFVSSWEESQGKEPEPSGGAGTVLNREMTIENDSSELEERQQGALLESGQGKTGYESAKYIAEEENRDNIARAHGIVSGNLTGLGVGGPFALEFRASEKFAVDQFERVQTAFDGATVKLLLRMPSRPPLKHREQFELVLRNMDYLGLQNSDLMVKLVSKNFTFRPSVIALNMSGEQSVTLTKSHGEPEFDLSLKVYLNNTVVQVIPINLWDRE